MKYLVKSFGPLWLVKALTCAVAFTKRKWPLRAAHKSLVLNSHSRTLSGKILRKMAFDRDPMLSLYADKFLVRNYVEKRVGKKYLNTLISVSDSEGLLREISLPNNFALKSNNGSGGIILVWDDAPAANTLPSKNRNVWSHHIVQPRNFEVPKAQVIARKWLSTNYHFRPGQFPEWAYKDIKPMLLIEELMLDEGGNLPSDFKFFMIGGKCRFIQLDTQRFNGHCRDLYTESWEKINGSYNYPQSGISVPRPEHLDEMLIVAKALSDGLDFVRVDLYQTSQGVKFGELTNYPGGGIEKFFPESLDYELGASWVQRY
jgi:hypothetical protein